MSPLQMSTKLSVIFVRRFSNHLSIKFRRFTTSKSTSPATPATDENVIVISNSTRRNESKRTSNEDPKVKGQEWVGRLIYNSYFASISDQPKGYRQTLKLRSQEPEQMRRDLVDAHQNQIPVALQMMLRDAEKDNSSVSSGGDKDAGNDNNEGNDIDFSTSSSSKSSKLQFPYRLFTSVQLSNDNASKIRPSSAVDQEEPEELLRPKKKNEADEANEYYEWFKDYGSPDSSILPSEVPCGGCGAILHCQDTSIPGYVPSERFKILTRGDLDSEICQRCYFLKEHNAALNVNISRDDYPKILSQIQDQFALVLLLVDLLDFPCSIWPGIIDIIGTKRPVILVGNKVDLLPQDSPKFLNQVKKCLLKTCEEMGLSKANVIHLELVSATTGFGIENLIDSVFHLWGSKGDVYIMGCTNVGKSSLFNAFLQSDLCKIRAVDIIQRATVSQWPGTTLNLLKFPVSRPSSGRMGQRAERLRQVSVSNSAHKTLRIHQLRETRKFVHSTLIGHIGQSFVNAEKLETAAELNSIKDMFFANPKVTTANPSTSNQIKGIQELDKEYTNSKWCFDTPGAVAENQILEDLTLPELVLTIPKEIIQPRTFIMKPGWTLFVAGLARIDYIQGSDNIRLTLFTAIHLPVTIALTEDAEFVYKEGLGSKAFGIPFGDHERLTQFPPLKASDIEMEGDGHKCSCGDIVISSTGWVAVTAELGDGLHLRAHTPNGTGIFCRKPSLLQYSVNFKGKRIRGTPAYNPTRVYTGH